MKRSIKLFYICLNLVLFLTAVYIIDSEFLSSTENTDNTECKDIQNPLPYYDSDYNRSVNRLLEPNTSIYVDEGQNFCRIEPYHLETNSKGLRYDETEEHKNEDTYRILVIGDSNVFGWGLNQSDTFPYILKQELASHHEKDYQVLNMGVPGAGIENHYLILRNIGLDYNPDLVIVSTGDRDSMTVPKQEKLREDAIEKLPSEDPDDVEINNKIEELLKDYWEDFSYSNSSMEYYKNLLSETALDKDFNLCIHLIYKSRSDQTEKALSEWSQDNENFCFIEKSQKLQKNSEKWRIAPYDPHYNAKANELIANQLYNELDSRNPLS